MLFIQTAKQILFQHFRYQRARTGRSFVSKLTIT